MTYRFFTCADAANQFLAEVKAEGFRGYVLRLSAGDYEVRFWA